MIPYHWGVFRISREEPEAPGEWLKNILSEKPELKVKILGVGESYSPELGEGAFEVHQ
jgi:hypothetical protein